MYCVTVLQFGSVGGQRKDHVYVSVDMCDILYFVI